MPEYTTEYLRYWGDEWVARWSEGHWALENIARCTLQYLKIYTNCDVCSGLSRSPSYRYRTERIFGVGWIPHEANGKTNYEVSCGFSELAWLESEWARDRLEKSEEPYWSNELIAEGQFMCGCISGTLFKLVLWIDWVEQRWDRIVGQVESLLMAHSEREAIIEEELERSA
ncbi:hypothetical protein FAGAP_1073 [Fusarium agapanthi]|uniref:Uncharacterized protein n=1 Tax=Fusarium agapanthi TaxID=1803897 RepID=A0A9P5BJW6_9HYPO|nr:hypothetical protein FAGAP_1073 [Fusarium agapanthi]